MGALTASRRGSCFRRVAGYGRRVREGELLRVSNHHAAAALAIEERPGRYLGYFQNKFGEQLVFVHDDGELDATVFHGDVDWVPRRVRDAGGLPDVGDLVLGEEEHAFLTACWIATAWRREDARLARRAA
jgi:hypothetical protein